MPPDLATLIAYDAWANARLFDAVRPLPEADWTRDLGSSFPSLQTTMAHLVAAEWVWLRRWQGEAPREFFDWMDTPSFAALRDVLTALEAERDAFLSGVPPGAWTEPLPFTLFDGRRGALPLADLVRHVVNHSTYHRGQAATMLRQLGHAPPSTDLLVFLREAAPTET